MPSPYRQLPKDQSCQKCDRKVPNPDNKDIWAVLEAGGGVQWIFGLNGALGTVLNVRTGERCIFAKVCFRAGIGLIVGAGFKVGAQFLAPRCGKEVGGLSIELIGEIASPAGGVSGSVGYGGGVGAGVGVGPDVGIGASVSLDGCLTYVIKCWGSPCECK